MTHCEFAGAANATQPSADGEALVGCEGVIGTPLADTPPAMSLVDQGGAMVSLDQFRGRPVLVTFAYAHCETVCPRVVTEVAAAQTQAEGERPVIVVVTLDPVRDTAARLPAMATAWHLGADAHVLSGPIGDVDTALNAWRIPRARNERTGDLSHPAVVYVIGRDGLINYAIDARKETILAALRAL